MRFSGIRLLLVFVATNTVMILMLVPSMTSKHPWLALILPGQFQAGGNYSGYWVFFALVVLVDAITVVAVALTVLLPALRDVTAVDLDRIRRRMAKREGIGDSAREAILAEAQEELSAARYRMFVGRIILIFGVLFLVLAFASVTLSFARALPQGSMFVQECIAGRVVCNAPADTREVPNRQVTLHDIQRFSLDQITRALLFGAPDVYGWHIGVYAGNPGNVLFAHFVFAFRILLGLMLVLTLVSLRPVTTGEAEGAAPSLKKPASAESQESQG